MYSEKNIETSYQQAKACYAEIGVNTDEVLKKLAKIPISLHCWQGDDVGGFEKAGLELSGGIQVTGNYPGKARSISELWQDLEKVYSLIPGKHRLNLHAMYADTQGENVDRNALEPKHFQSWIDWVKSIGLHGMDFNPTYFSHPLSDDGFTLSHPDKSIRQFWIEHGIACRKIGDAIGKSLNSPCVTNIWIPDGYKDIPVDRKTPRVRLKESLDQILKEKISKEYNLDAVESKLFGIGSESYVVGSHEFYMGYAISNNTLLCLDSGHFHPTETIVDKITATMLYLPEILLHVTRNVRWDSDHVVLLTDEIKAIAQEIVRGDFLERIHIGLDFFDATINRLAAWVIGCHAMLKALLLAMLEPIKEMKQTELQWDYTKRLADQELLKIMPFGDVWNYYCMINQVPPRFYWFEEIKAYEKNVLSQRK